MPNIHDYLLWRGDLPFHVSPMNEVDELILSQLAYVSFGRFVPKVSEFPQFSTLGMAAQRLLAFDPDGTLIHQMSWLWKNLKQLLEMVIASPRYRDIRLCAYVDELNDDTQFAALCMQLTEQVSVIAFRGTDDSLTGWKEDLLMALPDPIPAQKRAWEYLCAMAPCLPGKIALTGHSKGGNLAIFAAAAAPTAIQERIFCVSALDAPGFSNKLLHSPGYAAIRPKMHVLMPESAIVGRLLEHEHQYEVIRSTALGILQHDGFSWQVQGAAFIRAESTSAYSEYMHSVMKNWLGQLNEEQKREFLEAIFDMLTVLDAKKLDEAAAALVTKMPHIIRKLRTVDKETKEHVLQLLLSLGEATLKSVYHNILPREKDALNDGKDHTVD